MIFVAPALLIVILLFAYLQFKKNYKNKTLSNNIEITDAITQSTEIKFIPTDLAKSAIDCKQFETNIQILKTDNELLKQDINKLTKQISLLEVERNQAINTTKQIQLQNDILGKRIKELEANKKALIEELGGAVGREDLEYATWDLVLQTTKLLVKERDEAIKQNQSLANENNQLHKSINNFQSQITTKESEINSLRQKLRDAESEIKKLKTRDISPINNLQNQLNHKESRIKSLEIDNNEQRQTVKQLKDNIISKESNIKSLMQEKIHLETRLKELDNNLKDRQNNIESLKLKVEELNSAIITLKNQGKDTKKDERKNIEELQKLRDYIKQILVENKKLHQKIEILENTHYTDIKEDVTLTYQSDYSDVLVEYNNLIYLLQSDFTGLEMEDINESTKEQEFYFKIISKLCLINLLLVYKVRDLEEIILAHLGSFIIDDLEKIISEESNIYLGKALYTCNQYLLNEINLILGKTLFLNNFHVFGVR